MPILLMASALPPPVVQAQTHVGPGVPAPARIEVPGEGVTIPMQDMGGRPVVAMRVPPWPGHRQYRIRGPEAFLR